MEDIKTAALRREAFVGFVKDYSRRTIIGDKKLADMPGAISIAGGGALRRGAVCLFGLNPGGNPALKDKPTNKRTIEQALDELFGITATGDNEYWDGPDAKCGSSGRSPYRGRVRHLLCVLSGCDCGGEINDDGKCGGRALFAGNLIFIRAPNEKALRQFGGINQLAEKCWTVNEKIITEIVAPRLIIALGLDCYRFLRRQGRAADAQEEEKGEKPDKKKCRACKARFGDLGADLVYVPHLSYYPLDAEKRAEVVKWIARKLPRDG